MLRESEPISESNIDAPDSASSNPTNGASYHKRDTQPLGTELDTEPGTEAAIEPTSSADLANVEQPNIEQPNIEQQATEDNVQNPVVNDGLNHATESATENATEKNKKVSLEKSEAIAKPFEAEGLWPVFRNRNFLTLWSGQVFSQIADKIYLVLMIAIISTNFKSPDQTISGWVSAIMIAFTIPAVLFGSLAGVYVDRWRKKPVLVLTNLLRGLLVAILPVMLWITQGWSIAGLPVGFYILLVVTFLVSTLTQFFAPAEQAVIPLIVKEQNLLPANSLYTTTMMASVIVGFAVGDPLLALADTLLAPIDKGTGVGKSVLVGISYAIAGILLLLMNPHEAKTDPSIEQAHPWEDIKDGIAYLQKQVQVRAALIQLVVLFSVFAALAVLAVRLAEVIPTIRSSQFGFLLAAGGIGLAIGAIAIGQFGQRFSRSQLGIAGSLGMALMLSGLSLAPMQLWPSLILIGGLGLFGAMVGIPMQTTIQEETPEDMRGKVFGLQNNVVNIALSLPLALAGIAETFLGLRVVFGLLAMLVAVGGFFTWSLVQAALSENTVQNVPQRDIAP
ncbi:MAG: Major Facilitator Superfamily [Phormidesmis priestleyi Ana]|uniref:Major Facilitator Superfamily n=1 Tax=Phormidesmis priestleyi Ana TaxID=1666911 RepID=A0A0P8BSI2_9CYAN|nr:MAG: Major Facilitator Superfamily [Phormidesmis priestleyi Ana]